MKTITRKMNYTFLTLASLFVSFAATAQEKLDVDINVGKEKQWYMHPVAWIAGAAVFILILVALLRKK